MRLPHTWVRDPYIISFDVPPNRAVYIGTIRHEFKRADEDPYSKSMNYKITTCSDFDKAGKWFLRSRESLDRLVVDRTAESAPFNSGK
jgi:hypothetical protein